MTNGPEYMFSMPRPLTSWYVKSPITFLALNILLICDIQLIPHIFLFYFKVKHKRLYVYMKVFIALKLTKPRGMSIMHGKVLIWLNRLWQAAFLYHLIKTLTIDCLNFYLKKG